MLVMAGIFRLRLFAVGRNVVGIAVGSALKFGRARSQQANGEKNE